MGVKGYIRTPMSWCYIRQSLSQADQKHSADFQYDECYKAWLLESKRHSIPPWAGKSDAFVDIDMSGRKTKFSERPEGKRLMRRVRRGDHLYVWRIDRLGRRIFDVMDTVGRLVEYMGIRLHVANLQGEAMDLSTIAGKCVLMGLALAAEIEGEAISERVKATHAYRKRVGLSVCGRPPSGLGWKFEEINGVKVEVPDYDYRRTLTQLWLLRRKGYTFTEIAKRLNAGGYKNKDRKWSANRASIVYGKLEKHFADRHAKMKRNSWTPQQQLVLDPMLDKVGLTMDEPQEIIAPETGVKKKWEQINGEWVMVRIEDDGDDDIIEIEEVEE